MFTMYHLKREMRLSGILLKVSLYVDCVRHDGECAIAVNRIIQTKNWNPPKWHEIDTPEKALNWINKIDMDSLAYSYSKSA